MSVVVATYLGAERIGTCLRSLVEQSLAPERFEVVVVQNGPACATPNVVRDFRDRHPRHTIRLLCTEQPGAGAARNIGIDAARGEHLTIVDDDDWVGATYLEELLDAARPGVVPTALVCDVDESRPAGSTDGSFDNYVSQKLAPFTGQTVPAPRVSAVLGLHAGKLLPTSFVRAVRYRTDLRSGEDFVFMLGLYARAPFSLTVVPRDTGAVYFRQVRDNSVSRRPDDYAFLVSERLACVQALSEIQTDDPAAERLIRNAAGGQGAFAQRHLLAHPEDHARAVREAHERGIDSRPFWARANLDRAQDLALLYLFPPFQDTSAMVAARRLRARGVVTDVISQAADNIREREPSTWRIAQEYVGSHTVLPGTAHFHGWTATRTWMEEAVGLAMSWQAERGPYRSVYTRAMAPPSHFAGALMKVRNPGIHWLAEFSDPLLQNPYGEERAGRIERDELFEELAAAMRAAGFTLPDHDRYFEWAELLPYALADEIQFTNENQRTFMLDHIADPALAARAEERSTVAQHPTLPPEFYAMASPSYELEPGKVHIGYFGAFYLTRGLTEVVQAIRDLPWSVRRRVRLHVFTSHPRKLREEVQAEGLSDVILPRAYVPFLDFLALTCRFDALIVNDAATKQHHAINPYLPSKLSDYLGTDRDIWAIVEPGSVLSGTKTAWRSLLGDPEGAARVIHGLVEQHTSD